MSLARFALTLAILLLACGCSRPDPAIVDGTFELRPDGIEVGFTIAKPTKVRFLVELPDGAKTDVTLARLLPATRPDLVYVLEDVTVHRMHGPSTTANAELKHPGAYVLRVPPLPTAMEHMVTRVRVRITAR